MTSDLSKESHGIPFECRTWDSLQIITSSDGKRNSRKSSEIEPIGVVVGESKDSTSRVLVGTKGGEGLVRKFLSGSC